MLAKKNFHGAIKIKPVFHIGKPVPLVIFEQVLHVDVAFLKRLDNPIGFSLLDARVVGCLCH